jgi:RimJ/RimL family protein N-acetyltransferase
MPIKIMERAKHDSMSIDHTGFGVADVARAAAFYDSALAAIGLRRVAEIDGGIGYGVTTPIFWIDRFHTPGRNHTAFSTTTRDQVDAFHAAALTAGGTDNGAPAVRKPPYPDHYYAAFVRDLEGNNIEVVCRTQNALPVLECDRVRLRPFRATDRDDMFALFSHPEVARYWAFPPWTDPQQAADYLVPLVAPCAPDTVKLPWAIADRATDRLIGTATMFNIYRDQQRAEVGYSLQRSQWGQGLAREAVARVLAYGFDELKLRRIEADIDPRNAPSLALVSHFGFKREGLLAARWNVNGEICDSVVLGLLAADFRR